MKDSSCPIAVPDVSPGTFCVQVASNTSMIKAVPALEERPAAVEQ